MVVSAALAGALVVVAALIERRFGSAGAVDRALEATFNLVVPLLSFAVVGAVSTRKNLADATWPLARYGADPRAVGLGLVLIAIAAAAALGAGSAVIAALVAHAAGNPPLAGDAFTSGWIGALTAASYAAWFSAGATFGRRGNARWLVLLADAFLGGSSSFVGVIFPRAHAENLLGGVAPLHLSQHASTAALALSVVVLAVVATLRTRT